VDGFGMLGNEGTTSEGLGDWEERYQEERFFVDPKKGEIWVGRRAWVEGEEGRGGWKLTEFGMTVPDL